MATKYADVVKYFERSGISRKQLLETAEWFAFRELVLKRDGSRCQYCKAVKSSAAYGCLQAHHIYSIPGRLPWDYPLDALVTLCAKCHDRLHKTVTVPTFWEKDGKLVHANGTPVKDLPNVGTVIEILSVFEKELKQDTVPAPLTDRS
jgi:hypothetical protein